MEDNLRIKFVGFIQEKVNYIVDLDNREVFYKHLDCTNYTKLPNKFAIINNPITDSLTVSFKLADNINICEVEIYANCITHVNVTLTNTIKHEKTVLPEEFTTYDYFSKQNLLDSNGNLNLFIDYDKIFALSKYNLGLLYTNCERLDFMYELLQDIKTQKDFSIIIRNVLTGMRDKLDPKPTPLNK